MARVRVVVVGAGISGLTAALTLQAAGYAVTVCDRQRVPGGHLLEANADGTRVDAGESVITMRWVWDEFFQSIGEKTETHLSLSRVLRLGRYVWADGSMLDLDFDVETTTLAIERFAGSREARAYRAFARYAAEVYRIAEETLLRMPAPSARQLLLRGLREGWGPFTRVSAHRSLTSTVASFFDDPRLRQLFGYYAAHVGLPPGNASGTLSMLAHLDRDAAYRTTTDMKTLAWSLERVATRMGVTFLYGEAATQIAVEGAHVEGVSTSKRYLEAKAVVFAGELSSITGGELGDAVANAVGRHTPSQKQRTFSSITSAGVARLHGKRLPWRTVFFAEDAANEWECLARGRMPESSTLTLTLHDRASEGDRASDGASERAVLSALAPAVGASLGPAELADHEWEEKVGARLLRHGITLSWKSRETKTPRDYAHAFPGSDGSLFGPAGGGPLAAFRLRGARTDVRGLSLAARGVHPGPSLSFACLRGKRAAEDVIASLPR
ncbi:MAG: FAD-dependent oxidoreductase [Polyangiaceae bacterium]